MMGKRSIARDSRWGMVWLVVALLVTAFPPQAGAQTDEAAHCTRDELLAGTCEALIRGEPATIVLPEEEPEETDGWETGEIGDLEVDPALITIGEGAAAGTMTLRFHVCPGGMDLGSEQFWGLPLQKQLDLCPDGMRDVAFALHWDDRFTRGYATDAGSMFVAPMEGRWITIQQTSHDAGLVSWQTECVFFAPGALAPYTRTGEVPLDLAIHYGAIEEGHNLVCDWFVAYEAGPPV